jgi:hypothetical protein
MEGREFSNRIFVRTASSIAIRALSKALPVLPHPIASKETHEAIADRVRQIDSSLLFN